MHAPHIAKSNDNLCELLDLKNYIIWVQSRTSKTAATRSSCCPVICHAFRLTTTAGATQRIRVITTHGSERASTGIVCCIALILAIQIIQLVLQYFEGAKDNIFRFELPDWLQHTRTWVSEGCTEAHTIKLLSLQVTYLHWKYVAFANETNFDDIVVRQALPVLYAQPRALSAADALALVTHLYLIRVLVELEHFGWAACHQFFLLLDCSSVKLICVASTGIHCSRGVFLA